MFNEKTVKSRAPDFSKVQSEKRKRARLVQYNGAEMGRRYELDSAIKVIGRSSTVGIIINDPSVSRHHAMISQHGDQYELEDMASSNGTFINGERIESRAVLADGDVIGFGSILFKFLTEDHIDSLISDRIYAKATIDEGTGLFNKSSIMDYLQAEVKFYFDYAREFSIIYFDLDHFKNVNDRFGHHNGDLVLKEGAMLVFDIIREYDIPGRFGGEEFLILLPNTLLEEAGQMAEALRASFENHDFFLDTDKLGMVCHHQTISAGVTQFSKEMGTVKALLQDADRKLYRSKSEGRNRVIT